MADRFLVTGALGCIGAWTVRRLLADGADVFCYDLPGDPHRLRLVLEDEAALAGLTMINGDVTDLAGLERAVADHQITHIVHLAGLQIPLVRADPVRGMQVNAVGTTVIFEAALRHRDQVRGLAYASSAAVWGPRPATGRGRSPVRTFRLRPPSTGSPRWPTRGRPASTGPSTSWPAWDCGRTWSTARAGIRA